MSKIITNKIQCKHCCDIIESEYRHDYKMCKCKKVAVDGGTEYLRRSFPESPEKDYIELSEMKED